MNPQAQPLKPTSPESANAKTPRWLGDLLHQQVANQPEALAYNFLRSGENPEEPLTYGELQVRIYQLAGRLTATVSPGDRALLLFPQGTDFVIAFLACQFAQVIAVPLPLPRPHQRHWSRLSNIATNSNPAVLLAEQAADLAPGLKALPMLTKLPLIATRDTSVQAPPFSPQPIDSSGISFLQYTSGSTGQPKGVMVSHANILENLKILATAFHHQGGTPIVSWMPAFHDLGLIGNLLFALYSGSPCYLMSPAAFIQKPVRWLRAISDVGATLSGGPNFAYAWCLQHIRQSQCRNLDLSTWRLALNGAETVRAKVMTQFAEVFSPYGFSKRVFFPCYGLAEATLLVSGDCQADRPHALHLDTAALGAGHVKQVAPSAAKIPTTRTWVSVGQVRPPMKAVIVDPQSHQRCQVDRIGEIWLQGPCVALGYYRNVAETKAIFQAEIKGEPEAGPFLRTGDLGFFSDDHLVFTGRVKEVIVLDGINYFPQDIEAVVQAAHDDLQPGHGAAFAIEDEAGARLVVVQELRRTKRRNFQRNVLFSAIQSSLAEFFGRPADTLLLVKPGQVPKTSSGKIQRGLCRERFLTNKLKSLARRDDVDRTNASSADGHGAEQVPLAWSIAQALQIEDHAMDTDQPFANWGWDSKTMVLKSQHLARHLKRELPVNLLYDYPTPRRLMTFLTRPDTSAIQHAPVDNAPMVLAGIVGIGCRLPQGCNDPQTLWDHLLAGDSFLTGTPPADRPDDARGQGGWLSGIDRFDAAFFGISANEAKAMDPQQRILLEVVWEALENAGQAPAELAGSRTGVFVGMSSADYKPWTGDTDSDRYRGTGSAASIAANRISYLLDLRGPSLAVDTACSASLSALHLACAALERGECDAVIVAGINIVLDGKMTQTLDQAGMLAHRCEIRSFDAEADGYVRGEGCIAIVLRSLHSIRKSDRVYAEVRGTAMGQDGRSNGLTAPSRTAQQTVILEALARAKATPDQVGYIEAHGSGTPVGDPIELSALQDVFANRKVPLWVGSCKPNLGHLEAAAGLAGIAKAALALFHRRIPPQRHFETPNPAFPWQSSPLQVPVTVLDWQADLFGELAGISSFGFGGSNAHAVLGPYEPVADDAGPWVRNHVTVCVAAETETALSTRCSELAQALSMRPDLALNDIARTCNHGRQQGPHRAAIVSASTLDLAAALTRQDSLHANDAYRTDTKKTSLLTAKPKLVMVFSGQGTLVADAGSQLYQSEPVFRRSLDRWSAHLTDQFGYSGGFPWRPGTGFSAPGPWAAALIYTLGLAYSDLLHNMGLKPDAVCGHSLGELLAGTRAGIFTPEDGLALAVARGHSLAFLPEGGMLAVACSERRLAEWIAHTSPAVTIAAMNHPKQTIVSGPSVALDKLANRLGHQGIGTKRLTVGKPFHGRLPAKAKTVYRAALDTISLQKPVCTFVSTVTPGNVNNIREKAYWLDQLTSPVRFAEGINQLHQAGMTYFVEVGPKPALGSSLRSCLRDRPVYVGAISDQAGSGVAFHKLVADLFVAGFELDWAAYHGQHPGSVVDLPTYPFERQTYWLPPINLQEPPTLASTDSPTRVAPLPEPNHEIGQTRTDDLDSGRIVSWTRRWQPSFVVGENALWSSPLPALPPCDTTTPMGENFPKNGVIETREALNELATAYLVQTLAELPGLESCNIPDQATIDGQAITIDPTYKMWLTAVLNLLDKQQTTTASKASLSKDGKPVSCQLTIARQRAEKWRGWAPAFFELIDRCGQCLSEILTGKQDSLAVLFPGGNHHATDDLYREWPESRVLHDQLSRWLSAALMEADPDRHFQCLEVGAGSGATSEALLASTPSNRSTFWFTDISSTFLRAARQRWSNAHHIRYERLDIESDPLSQPVPTRTMDLVVAANVVHATKDPVATLARLKKYLKPGGWLVLVETLQPAAWLYLTFGLTRGWWRTGNQNPLWTAEQWQTQLTRDGWSDVVCRTLSATPTDGQQGLIVARLPTRPTENELALLFAQKQANVKPLKRALENRGLRSILIRPGKTFQVLNPQSYRLRPHHADDVARLRQQLEKLGVVRLLLHGWSLHLKNTPGGSLRSHMANVSQSAWLMDVINQWPKQKQAGAWLITSGAASIDREQSNPWQAAVNAMARCAANESTGTWLGSLDLPNDSDARFPDHLADILCAGEDQGELVWRNGRFYKPVPHRVLPPTTRPLPVMAHASYLITGAFGHLGPRIAQWLVKKGAQNLVLTTRPGKRPAAERQRLVEPLRDQGIAVRVVELDFAKESHIRRLTKTLEHSSHPPLRGVVHAAGIPGKFQTLANLDSHDFESVCDPKIAGTILLHKHLAPFHLDFWLGFGSVAAEWGFPGQAAYAAANGFMAACPHSYGYANVRTISWGLWQQSAPANVERRWHDMGLAPLESEAALASLDHWDLADPATITTVAIRDPAQLTKSLPRITLPRLDQTLMPRSTDQNQTDADHPQTPHDPGNFSTWFYTRVASLLGLEANMIDRRRSLLQLGFDSLVVAELQQAIQQHFAVKPPLESFFEDVPVDTLVQRWANDLNQGSGNDPVEVELEAQVSTPWQKVEL